MLHAAIEAYSRIRKILMENNISKEIKSIKQNIIIPLTQRDIWYMYSFLVMLCTLCTLSLICYIVKRQFRESSCFFSKKYEKE